MPSEATLRPPLLPQAKHRAAYVCPALMSQAEVHSNPVPLMGLIRFTLLPDTQEDGSIIPICAPPAGRALSPATIQENFQRCPT